MNDYFFSKAFENMTAEQKENFYKTVFMNDDSEFAANLRLEYYKTQLRSMGKNVKIGSKVKIVNPQYVSIGDDVNIYDDVTIIARGEDGIEIGNGCYICERVYLDTQNKNGGYIKIGNSVYLGTGTTLFGHKGLEIGDNCLFAQNIVLTPYSHKFDNPGGIIWHQGGNCKKVTIGNDCYIGMGVCIMYTGDIGDGSVIGAGSTVVKPIEPYSVAVGSPAKVIKKRVE